MFYGPELCQPSSEWPLIKQVILLSNVLLSDNKTFCVLLVGQILQKHGEPSKPANLNPWQTSEPPDRQTSKLRRTSANPQQTLQ